MNNRIFILLLVIVSLWSTRSNAAFEGATLTDGESYYLYNIYQSKFLSYGNAWGTQVSLDNSAPLCCTVTSSGSGYIVNTHFSLETSAYNASVDNYLYVADGIPVVNSNWGSSDSNPNVRDPQVWNITAVDEGYNLTYDSSGATMALMFGAGSACVVDTLAKGFNADKSIWKLVPQSEYEEYLAKNRFTVAALNVDGMPQSIRIAGVYDLTLNADAQEEDGATAIGNKLRTMGYDVVGVSEDFNFHSELWTAAWNDGAGGYNATTHRGKISVTASTYAKYIVSESPLFDIDGLCLFYKMANVDADVLSNSESWTSWNEHYGYADNGADGLIDKGYRYYLVQLADGTQFDLYIMHMDAEVSTGDIEARASQLTQLADAILASSNGRPIIVMGDTNCRYTRDRVKTLFIDAINADSRFTVKDPWVEYGQDGIYPACNGNSIMASEYGYRKGEVVDKVFYINNTESDIRLVAESYVQDLSFVDDSGTALADHWPCVVEFSYHDYDPTIDDAVDEDLSGTTYYVRNVESGAFLKAGGWWGTHAVQGEYGSPMTIAKLSSGKYVLQSNIGYVTQGDPYMDGAQTSWTLVQSGDYYIFTYDDNGTTMALTGNDATTFPAGPNTRYVTCATLDTSDDWQKWELLTAEDLEDEMQFATSSNPYNVSYLLPGANFDRNDTDGNASWGGWPTTATKMTCSVAGGDAGNELGNLVSEVYVQSYSGLTTYGTTWEVNQSLTGVPNGHYKVTCQAFFRVNYDVGGDADVYLYARTTGTENSVKLLEMYSGASCTTNYGSTTNGSYYYPNSMAEAGVFFSQGYYNNEVEIDVTDGTLTLAVGKTNTTKGSSVWTCFDNFQLYYYPSETYYRGDLNNDKRVSLQDVPMLVDYLLGNTSPYNRGNSDVNADHKRTITDVQNLSETLSGR